jgi:hypothetical protein
VKFRNFWLDRAGKAAKMAGVGGLEPRRRGAGLIGKKVDYGKHEDTVREARVAGG